MKIVQIITALGFGGAEKLLVNISNALANQHQVTIIYLKDEPKLASLLHPGVTLMHVPLGNRTTIELRRVLKKIEPDVVNSHLGHAHLITALALTGLPIPYVATLHNQWYKKDKTDKYIFLALRTAFNLLKSKTRVTAVSDAVAAHAHTVYKVPNNRLFTIKNAIPDPATLPDPLTCRQHFNVPPNTPCIVYIGRFSKQKAVHNLINGLEQLAKHTHFKALLVGEGMYWDDIKQLIEAKNLTAQISLEGTTLTPEKYIAAADFLVLTSIFEGLPTVILEAFRQHTPVVVSNIAGNTEIVSHGQNGFLYGPPNNAQAFAQHSLALISNNDLLKKLGQNARKDFEEKHTIAIYVQKLLEVYNTITPN